MNANIAAKIPSASSALTPAVSAVWKVAAKVNAEQPLKQQPITQDTVTLSDSSKALQPTPRSSGKKKASAKEANPDPKPPTPSEWSKERLAKLDQLELKVRQGQYNVESFMVDEIAVRLARLIVSS